MKNVLILHGTQGNSKENWFPWLKLELEKKGYKVWLPDLPDANIPNLKKYNDFILSNKDWKFDSESVIVGHSSGSVAILALLNELPDEVVVDTCILVAPFEKDSPGGQWEPNKELFDYKPDLKKVKKHCKNFILIISDNDKYCPVEYVRRLGKELGAKVIETHGDGHFSVGSGGPKYRKLPVILSYIIKDDELLDLVNEKDEVIGTVEREIVRHDPTKYYRVVAIAIFNNKGETLIQKRSPNKSHPGKWETAVSGHVLAGEHPDDTSKREVFEELGIKETPVYYGKWFVSNRFRSKFLWLYYLIVDNKIKIKINNNEVAETVWIKPDKLEEFAKDNEWDLEGYSHKEIIEIKNYLKL